VGVGQIRGHGIQSIIRNGAYLMAVGWVETGLRLLYMVVVARYLGPSLYGYWAYGAAVYGLALGLSGFGFDTLMVIRLGGDKRGAADFIGLTLTLRLGLLALAGAGLAAFALAGDPDETSRLVLLGLIPALIGRGMAVWARVCFLGYERMGAYLKIVTAVRSAEVICGLLLLFSGGGLLGIVFLHSLSWLIEGALGVWRVYSRLSPFAPRFNRIEAAEFLRQGAVLGLAAGLFTWLVAGPLILFRHFGGDMAQFGQFAIALNVTMILVTSMHAYLAAALPVLTRSAERQDPRVAHYGKITVLTAAGLTSVVAGIAWLLGPPVAEWVLGPDFALAGKLVGPCLVIGGLIVAPTGYAQVLLLKGRRWPGVIANSCGGLALVAGLPPAISIWGVEGAVLATGAAWLLHAIVLVAWGARRSSA
jgi:O-antigen/teichoic acid export membrane protein